MNLGLSCTPPRVQSNNLPESEVIIVKNFVVALAENIGVSRKVLVDQDRITAILLMAEGEGILFVSNHSHQKRVCQIRLDTSLRELCDLETKENIPLIQEDGKTVLKLIFNKMEVKLLKAIKK